MIFELEKSQIAFSKRSLPEFHILFKPLTAAKAIREIYNQKVPIMHDWESECSCGVGRAMPGTVASTDGLLQLMHKLYRIGPNWGGGHQQIVKAFFKTINISDKVRSSLEINLAF